MPHLPVKSNPALPNGRTHDAWPGTLPCIAIGTAGPYYSAHMIVSAHQPYFCPYPGYFAKAMRSDVFVVLDAVQFPRGSSWVTRNRFKNDQGAFWMSVPVKKKGLGLQRIDGVRVLREGGWGRKHLESIRTAYARAPYLDDHLPVFERAFTHGQELIRDLDLELITHALKYLGSGTRVVLQSSLHARGNGTGLLVELCRELKASAFLTYASARKYLDEGLFADAGIALSFFSPQPVVYPQLWGDFIPNLSVFDLLLTCGEKSREIMEKQYRR